MNFVDESIRIDAVGPDVPKARKILRSYIDDVASRFYGRPATGPEIEAALNENLSSDLVAPHGLFLLAHQADVVLGCVGVRWRSDDIAEVQRLFVTPTARGYRIGARLMDQVEYHARETGRTVLRLDTRHDLVEARRLYAVLGYDEIPAFNCDQYAEHWLGKSLA